MPFTKVPYPPLARSPFPDGEGKEEAASPQKGSQPRLAAPLAPSKGRGSRGHSLLPMEGGAQKGRRLDGESGMKKSEGDRLKCAINESTLSTADAVPLPRWGRQKGGGFAAKKKANPASLRSAAPSKGRGSRGHSFLPMERGGIAHSPYRHFERKREIFFRLRSSRRCGDSGISAPKPSPRGEGGERSEPDRVLAV